MKLNQKISKDNAIKAFNAHSINTTVENDPSPLWCDVTNKNGIDDYIKYWACDNGMINVFNACSADTEVK